MTLKQTYLWNSQAKTGAYILEAQWDKEWERPTSQNRYENETEP